MPYREAPPTEPKRPTTNKGRVARWVGGAVLAGAGLLGAEQMHRASVNQDRQAQSQEDERVSWDTLSETEAMTAANHVSRRLFNGGLLEHAQTAEQVEELSNRAARSYLRSVNKYNRENVRLVLGELNRVLYIAPDSGSMGFVATEAARDAHTDSEFAHLDRSLRGFNHQANSLEHVQPIRVALSANNGEYVAHVLQAAERNSTSSITAEDLDLAFGLSVRGESRGDIDFIQQSLRRSPQTFTWFTTTFLPKMEAALRDRNHWNAISRNTSTQSQFSFLAQYLNSASLHAFVAAANAAMDAPRTSPAQPRHRHHRHHE